MALIRRAGEALGAVEVLDVGLEAVDHDLVERLLVRLVSLHETLRVEHFQERPPRPGVAVVRGRGQERRCWQCSDSLLTARVCLLSTG